MNSFLLIIVFVHLSWISLSLSAETVCIESERETLLKLKHYLIDPSNRLFSWNASLNPNCCHWYGVLCNNVTSHVAELHLTTPLPLYIEILGDNVLEEALEKYEEVYDDEEVDEEAYKEYSKRAFRGEINLCLVDLKHLNYLDFSGNLFGRKPIPSFIATMTSLTHLNLSRAGFMGNIPLQIGNLSNLLYLDLSYAANGAIPSQIGNLSNLLHLDLRGYYYEYLFHEKVDWLSSLSKLSYLDLGNTWSLGRGMPIPSFLGSMTNLIHLDLSHSGFRGNIPPQIGNLSNLAYLDLRYVVNGTIPFQIGNLSNLLFLNLRSDYYIDQTLFVENDDWWSSLSKLEYLDLGGANLSESVQLLHTLQVLSSLKHLHLSECTFSSYNQPSFVNLSSLLTLDISYISHHSIISLIPDGLRNLTLLENLNLHGNSLSSSIPHWLFGALSHLKFLDLSYNNLQGVIPDVLGNLTSLIALYMVGNQLKGPIPSSLGKVTSLVRLDLSHNQLSGNLTLDYYDNKVDGEHPKSVGKLSSLRVLSLSSNQLGGNPFKSLGSLSKLLYLEIDDNHFQGVVTESHLENLTSLKEFYASGNKLTLKVGRHWHPTFKLTHLDMSCWQLGPNFPSWTHSQNKLQHLVMSNSGILDYIPHYFWEACYSLEYLNLSNNHIH
ncbi:LRR receptor-like serine/threonine-protein kinase RGI5, partial [Vigna umbellata]|uniref:LRR receptor-like serine/threonine-protein kinase RGI5 n=1 Tax=Vigna umbellata TaxID=87088 RepID=UPI001F5E7AB3